MSLSPRMRSLLVGVASVVAGCAIAALCTGCQASTEIHGGKSEVSSKRTSVSVKTAPAQKYIVPIIKESGQ